MRAVLMGPPGAGKGTQAVRLAAAWGVPHVSTGDLLREAVANGSQLGTRVRDTLNAGRLVSDEMITELLSERLGRRDCNRGFVLDGYPRTERQAKDLDELMRGAGVELERVVLLEVPDEVVVRRLSGRRQCPSCNAVYQEDALQAGAETCPRCSTRLVRRTDDRPETVRERLDVYRRQTMPVAEYYRRTGRLNVVNGQGTPDEVNARLLAVADAAPR